MIITTMITATVTDTDITTIITAMGITTTMAIRMITGMGRAETRLPKAKAHAMITLNLPIDA